MDGPRRIVHILVSGLISVALAGGCGGSSAPSPTSATPTASTSAAPTSELPAAARACPPGGPDETGYAAPQPTLHISAPLSEAFKVFQAELFAAIGNPDTGSSSEAMTAFEAARKGSDPDKVRATADVILGHLAAACAAVASYFDEPGNATWGSDVRSLLDETAVSIGAMRDATIAGRQADGETARVQMGYALLDHFWPAFGRTGPDANRVSLPDGRAATATRIRYSTPVSNAFDGSDETAWTAGRAPAPQWIELDLGWTASVGEIRLLTFMDSLGTSEHRLSVGASSGDERTLTRLTGTRADSECLYYRPGTTLSGVRYVRITTETSAGTVGWREIEVKLAPGSTPSACSGPGTTMMAGVTAMGEPAKAGAEPALAVDGKPSTGWDPGDVRAGATRGWLRVVLARPVDVTAVRVLLSPGPVTARYAISGFTPDGRSFQLGEIAPVTATGGWASVAGPTPCEALSSVDVSVSSEEPAGRVQEVEVLGTPGS